MSKPTSTNVEADRNEIMNLMFRYAELLNLGEVDEVAQLFTYGKISSSSSDAVHDGPEAIAAWYRKSVVFPEKLPDTLLFVSNIQLEMDGDKATGKAYFMAVHAAPSGLAPVVAGRYRDEFERIDGRWWFRHRHMMTDLVGDISSHVTANMDEASK